MDGDSTECFMVYDTDEDENGQIIQKCQQHRKN